MNQYQQLSYVCQRLEAHDETQSLVNLSCQNVGSEGVVKLAASCGYDVTQPPSPTTTKEGGATTSLTFSNNGIVDSPLQSRNATAAVSSKSTWKSPLVALWLEGNDIYPCGARALHNLLQVSPRLKYLYVSSNYMGNSGVSALAPQAFRQCTVCHLSDNKVNAAGAISIAEALQQDICQVQTLLLDKNALGDKGMSRIAEALRHNTSVKHLDVRYNKIGKEGVMAIRDVLQSEENTTLEYVLWEEEEEDDQSSVVCTRRPPKRRNRKMPRLMEKLTCNCEQCHLRHEIDYLLALNRAGRSAFGDVSLRSNLWPRILSKVSHDDPSLLFTMLETRPDVPLRR